MASSKDDPNPSELLVVRKIAALPVELREGVLALSPQEVDGAARTLSAIKT